VVQALPFSHDVDYCVEITFSTDHKAHLHFTRGIMRGFPCVYEVVVELYHKSIHLFM